MNLKGIKMLQWFTSVTLDEWLTLATIHFLALISPGPDFAVVMKNSMIAGKKSGLFTALGIASALLVHCAYSTWIFFSLSHNQEGLFSFLKLCGAIMLFILAIKTWKQASSSTINSVQHARKQSSRAFLEGFSTNLFNPKVPIFMLSLFSILVTPQTTKTQLVSYTIFMELSTFVWFAFVAHMICHGLLQAWLQRWQKAILKGMSALFLLASCIMLGSRL